MIYIDDPDFQLEDTAVALGKFEGLHRGHQMLLDKIQKQNNNGLKSVVFTFDRPPGPALTGDMTYQQIYTKTERRFLLEKREIDVLIEHPFTKAFASLSPEEFVRHILVGKAGAKVVVVGTDFRFGKKRSGSVEDLKALSGPLGYRLIVLDKFRSGGSDISSTRIRFLLEQGNMEEAEKLLGRPYSIFGRVVHGKELGRTIQIPTVNQKAEQNKLIPPNGVYVSRITVGDERYYGITNIGVKPTVEKGSAKGIETNIFHFNRQIYGEMIEVELLHYKRPEKKFSSVEELKAQMIQDVQYGLAYAEEHFNKKSS